MATIQSQRPHIQVFVVPTQTTMVQQDSPFQNGRGEEAAKPASIPALPSVRPSVPQNQTHSTDDCSDSGPCRAERCSVTMIPFLPCFLALPSSISESRPARLLNGGTRCGRRNTWQSYPCEGKLAAARALARRTAARRRSAYFRYLGSSPGLARDIRPRLRESAARLARHQTRKRGVRLRVRDGGSARPLFGMRWRA